LVKILFADDGVYEDNELIYVGIQKRVETEF